MNKINTFKLYESFPQLYIGTNYSPFYASLKNGFEFKDGWFDLMYSFSKELINYCIKNNLEIPKIVRAQQKCFKLDVSIKFKDYIKIKKEDMNTIRKMISSLKEQSLLVPENVAS